MHVLCQNYVYAHVTPIFLIAVLTQNMPPQHRLQCILLCPEIRKQFSYSFNRGSMSAYLKSFGHRISFPNQSSEQTGKTCRNSAPCSVSHPSIHAISCPSSNNIRNFCNIVQKSCRRSMNHTLCRIAADHSWNTGICNGFSFIDYSAKLMSTHSFNDSIAVLTRCKARSSAIVIGAISRVVPRFFLQELHLPLPPA